MKSTKIITVGTKILKTKTGEKMSNQENTYFYQEYGILLGDTIVNGINGEQISDNHLARI